MHADLKGHKWRIEVQMWLLRSATGVNLANNEVSFAKCIDFHLVWEIFIFACFVFNFLQFN